jgi:hypothetical protein
MMANGGNGPLRSVTPPDPPVLLIEGVTALTSLSVLLVTRMLTPSVWPTSTTSEEPIKTADKAQSADSMPGHGSSLFSAAAAIVSDSVEPGSLTATAPKRISELPRSPLSPRPRPDHLLNEGSLLSLQVKVATWMVF